MPFLKKKIDYKSRAQILEDRAKKNGLRNYFYTPRGKYRGTWKNDLRDGYGAMATRKFELYEGQWERNYRHGFGILLKPVGERGFLLLVGNWKNGRKFGEGEEFFTGEASADDVCIVHSSGDWEKGKLHAFGQFWYSDGSYYAGSYKDKKRQGYGLFVTKRGNRYEGFWSEDKKHGQGRYLHLETGQMQEGFWEEDVCIRSTVSDIPFRQTAIKATEYPLLILEKYPCEELEENHFEILTEDNRDDPRFGLKTRSTDKKKIRQVKSYVKMFHYFC